MQDIDTGMFSWNRLGMTRQDWRALAGAFYALTFTKEWYVFLGRCM